MFTLLAKGVNIVAKKEWTSHHSFYSVRQQFSCNLPKELNQTNSFRVAPALRY